MRERCVAAPPRAGDHIKDPLTPILRAIVEDLPPLARQVVPIKCSHLARRSHSVVPRVPPKPTKSKLIFGDLNFEEDQSVWIHHLGDGLVPGAYIGTAKIIDVDWNSDWDGMTPSRIMVRKADGKEASLPIKSIHHYGMGLDS